MNKGALRFENVSFSYPTRPDVPVLKCLTIEVPQGMTTAIVGASGSGKSTMLELVARFYEVTGVRTKPGESNDRDIESESESECESGGGCGRVLFDGHDVLDLDPTWLRRHVAMVRQEPVMFGMTIRENIAYACAAAGRDVSNAEVIAAAKRAHAHEFISQFPEGCKFVRACMATLVFLSFIFSFFRSFVYSFIHSSYITMQQTNERTNDEPRTITCTNRRDAGRGARHSAERRTETTTCDRTGYSRRSEGAAAG